MSKNEDWEVAMPKKHRGIFKFFSTKRQHSDEEIFSKSNNVGGQATSRVPELGVIAKGSVEINLEANKDSLEARSSAIVSSTKETVQVEQTKSRSQNIGSKRILTDKKMILESILLSSAGATFLLFAYLETSLIITFTGLGLLLWGILIICVSPSRRIPAELIGSFSVSMQKSINDLVRFTGHTGEAIYFHPKSLAGFGQGFVFVPHYTYKRGESLGSKIEALNKLPYSSEMKIPSPYLDTSGIFISAPSQGLVSLLEEKLNINFATVDMTYLQQILPKLLIQELEMVDEISIEELDTNVGVSIVGHACARLCQSVTKESQPGSSMGCPICSGLALIISKVTGSPISMTSNSVHGDTINTVYTRLIP